MEFSGNFKLKYLKNTKQITLVRNIIAALVYESRGICLEDTLVLYDILPSLIEKAEKDEQFKKSHGSGLITTYEIIKNSFNPTKFPYKPRKRVIEKLQESLQGWIPTRQAYLGWKGNFTREQAYEVIPQGLNLRLLKVFKERSRIGVGYRDKGCRKDPAFDGSPSWQEVDRHTEYLDRLWFEEPDEYERISPEKRKRHRPNRRVQDIENF